MDAIKRKKLRYKPSKIFNRKQSLVFKVLLNRTYLRHIFITFEY